MERFLDLNKMETEVDRLKTWQLQGWQWSSQERVFVTIGYKAEKVGSCVNGRRQSGAPVYTQLFPEVCLRSMQRNGMMARIMC